MSVEEEHAEHEWVGVKEVVKNGMWEREGGSMWRRSEKVRRECVEGGRERVGCVGEGRRVWGVWRGKRKRVGCVGEGRRETEKSLTCIAGPIHRATSVINGVTYPPWNDADLSELRTVSALPQDYKDPAGLVPLANKQKAQLGAWMRPHEICDHPKMVHLISSLTIKQVCSLIPHGLRVGERMTSA